MIKSTMDIYKEIYQEWYHCASVFPDLPIFNDVEKQKNEKALSDKLPKLLDFLQKFPKYDQAKQKKWKEYAQRNMKSIVNNDVLFSGGMMDDAMSEAFIEVTSAFLREARSFDDELSMNDIGQAMRNVWIVVILQTLFKEPITYSKAIFGYSMLYPYSDNYLDEKSIDSKAKKEFNEIFMKRLKGENIEVKDGRLSQIFKLIQSIEEVFDRSLYPNVYEGLYLIMEGQILSLSQHMGLCLPYTQDLLGISIYKGAASVIADGYLIRGVMSEAEFKFCARYGFMLQLGDDFQDIRDDRKHGHATIFSVIAEHYELDPLVLKLLNYTAHILDDYEGIEEDLKALIIKNSTMLIIISALNAKETISEELLKKMEMCLPVHMKYIDQLKDDLSNHPVFTLFQDEAWLKEMIDTLCEK